jgi:hypothetical protein
MRRFVPLILLLLAADAWAEKTVLSIPGKGQISFEAPPLIKLKEVSGSSRYEYQASSAGTDKERVRVSVLVEPTECGYGQTTKDITRCFLEQSDQIPGLVKESRNTECSEQSCTVVYMVAAREAEKDFRQLHINLVFSYRKGWGHVHLSVVNPTEADVVQLLTFPSSVSYKE